MAIETKSPYIVRSGFFCPVGSSIHIGGETVNLTHAEYLERRHMLEEPVIASSEPKKETFAK